MTQDRKAASERMAEVRGEIDSLDQDILALLNRRAALSLEVGAIKAGTKDIIFKPFREKDVLDGLLARSRGPLPAEHLRAVYREIFSSSRALQRPQRVGYLGPEGTFSYFAGVEFLGRSVEFSPMPDFEAVFSSVAKREMELGIIPLENSLQGTVGQSLDHFLTYSNVHIQAELFCRICHSLLGRASSLSEIKTVYSHPQPLAQCAGWLRTNLPNAAIIPTESTAAAARRVMETTDDPTCAAIGHHRLASRMGLNIIASGIEDLPDNWTRFVIISSTPSEQDGREKTSMLFSLPDRPGSLVEVLQLLAHEGINMKKLESRPQRGEKWKYVFFVDVECDLSRQEYAKLVSDLSNACHSLRILGSYPAGPSLDVSAGAPE